ncbi:MAG: radical SAM protein [Armatimonadota bacterium]
MVIREIEAAAVLTRSKLPASDYCINPYVGCAHGCAYCYARFMRRFTGHSEPWGAFVDVRTNAAAVLARQLRRHPPPGVVLLGSVTDCYQPAERKHEVTRAILKVLTASELSVSILTKSDLVLRDIDILKELPKCEVGLTVTGLDDGVSSGFEPLASSATGRLNALQRLKAAGLRTYAFVGPILPGFTDVAAVVRKVAPATDFVMFEALNTSCGNAAALDALLRSKYPSIRDDFLRLAKSSEYWDEIEEVASVACRDTGTMMAGFFRHARRAGTSTRGRPRRGDGG